eukprot:gnl/MRDRNA2_/MRDRNA2_73733_c0_seq1.p2 gnl/MRDRNA2_/MRDRNA2_73733_c0~~gnl/MRDRNA2_/MRDRNA2_73733_c0_seq1.p2  ORF type:complete len:125 (-),score=25.93 gnl/MRDRNA2_/MRDRNA2_73733_c0_seq1:135-509(-)
MTYDKAGFRGIVEIRAGYTGGRSKNPTYESVCAGDGHTEALKIKFDAGKTSYKELLDLFWKLYEEGEPSPEPQYKMAIWYHDEEQKQAALDSMEEHARLTGSKPKLDILPATDWTDVESSWESR